MRDLFAGIESPSAYAQRKKQEAQQAKEQTQKQAQKAGADYNQFLIASQALTKEKVAKDAKQVEKEKQDIQKTLSQNTGKSIALAGLGGIQRGQTWGAYSSTKTPLEQQLLETAKEQHPWINMGGEILGFATSPITKGVGVLGGALSSLIGKGATAVAPTVAKTLTPIATNPITQTAGKAGFEMAGFGGTATTADLYRQGGIENVMQNKGTIAEEAFKQGAFGTLLGGGFAVAAKGIGATAKGVKNFATGQTIERGIDDAFGGFRPSIEGQGLRPIPQELNAISDVTAFRPSNTLALPMSQPELRWRQQLEAYNKPSGDVVNVPSGGFKPPEPLQLGTRPEPLRLKEGTINAPPAKPVRLGESPQGKLTIKPETIMVTKKGRGLELSRQVPKTFERTLEDFTPQGKTKEPIRKYTEQMKQIAKGDKVEPTFTRETPKRVYPGEMVDVTTPPKVQPQYVKEVFKEGKPIKQTKVKAKNKPIESPTMPQKVQGNINSPKVNSKPLETKIETNSNVEYSNEVAPVVERVKTNKRVPKDKTLRVGIKDIKIKSNNFTRNVVEARQPTQLTQSIPQIKNNPVKQLSNKIYTTKDGKPISQTRTNTIERTTEFSDEGKSILKREEFGYDAETVDEWVNQGANRYSNDKQGIIDDLMSDKPLSGPREIMESSMVIKEAEKEAVKTGVVDKFLSYTKKYAEKLRENARALKAHDAAWEKSPTPTNTVIKAQRVVNETQETILKGNTKLNSKIKGDVKRYQEAVNNAVDDATKKTLQLLDIDLQLFGNKRMKLEQMIGKHFKTDPARRGEILDKLVKDFQLEGAEAKSLADRINRIFDEKFQKSADNYLKRLLKSEKSQDPTLEKVLKLLKSGAYDNEALANIIKEKYGLPILSPDEAKQMIKMVDDLNKMNAKSEDHAIQLAKIRRMIEDKQVSTWVDKQRAVKNLALLGNPATIVTNIGGNTLLGTAEIGGQNTAGVLLDRILSLRTGNRTVGFSNIKALAKGVIKGAKDALIDSAGGLRLRDLKGLSTKQKVATLVEGFSNPINRPIFENTQNKFELMRGLAFKGKNKLMMSDKKSVRIIGNFLATSGKIGRVLENALYTSLGGFDRMAKQPYYDDTLNMLMKGNKVTEATEEMKKLAEKIAEERTFTDINVASNLGRWLLNAPKRITDNPKIANLIEFAINSQAPYLTTPLNIGKRAIEYSPLGLAEGMARYVKALAKPNITLAEQRYIVDRVTRGIVGSTLLAMGFYAYEKGLTTGQRSKNIDMNQFMNDVQINPNSIKIGDTTIDLVKLQPLTTSAVAGTNLNKALKEGSDKYEVIQNMSEAIASAFEFYTDIPVIQSLKKLFGNNFQEDTLGERIVSAIFEIPKQYYPGLLKKSAYVSDEEARSTYSPNKLENKLINPVKKMTPGIREDLPQSYGTLGQPLKEYSGNNSFWNVFFNPVKVGKTELNSVQSEILRLYNSNEKGNESVFPNVADKYIEISGHSKKMLTGEERSEYQKIMGEDINNALSKLFESTGYTNLSEVDKIRAVQQAIEYSKTNAKSKMADILGMEEQKKKANKPLKIKIPNKPKIPKKSNN